MHLEHGGRDTWNTRNTGLRWGIQNRRTDKEWREGFKCTGSDTKWWENRQREEAESEMSKTEKWEDDKWQKTQNITKSCSVKQSIATQCSLSWIF